MFFWLDKYLWIHIKTIFNHAKDCHNHDSSLAISACVCQLISIKRSNSLLDKDKTNNTHTHRHTQNGKKEKQTGKGNEW